MDVPVGVLAEDKTDTTINVSVEKPQPKPWPKRRKPKNNYNEAMHFIGQSILYFEKELKTKLTVTNIDKLEHIYGVWCWNTGLRGQEKAAVWRIIKAQILDVKATATSKTQEL